MSTIRAVIRTLDNRTPAQLYCLVFGLVLIAVGLVGFAVNASFAMGSDMQGGRLLGLFEVNGWHNLVHLLSGLAALAAVRFPAHSRTFAFGFGGVYGAVTILGLAAGGNGLFHLIAMNPADNFLHLAIAAAGLGAGMATQPAGELASI